MSHWNYRVVHRILGEQHEFAIHEVHYDDEPGEIKLWSGEPVAASGESVDELLVDLRRMEAAAELPVLEYGNLPAASPHDVG